MTPASLSDRVWLLRHGDTAWSEAGRHTGRREVELSERGRQQARAAGRLLAGRTFDHVLVSPQERALETCELAGLRSGARVCEELVEWDYGQYEGLTDQQTAERQPRWDLFRDGAAGGESPQEVGARIDRVIDAVMRLDGTTILVGHGKLLRALSALWLGLGIGYGSVLPMDPAAIAVLEREADGPRLALWNLTASLVAG